MARMDNDNKSYSRIQQTSLTLNIFVTTVLDDDSDSQWNALYTQLQIPLCKRIMVNDKYNMLILSFTVRLCLVEGGS